jgi:hypothetical protein
VIIISHLEYALLTYETYTHLSSVRNSPKYRKEQFKFFVLYSKLIIVYSPMRKFKTVQKFVWGGDLKYYIEPRGFNTSLYSRTRRESLI